MNVDTVLRLLKNAGFRVTGFDGAFIHMEDPSCILRGFETFIEYAWFAIVFITGVLLFGWAISMIRGSKNDIFINLRNLLLIFGILSSIKPVINIIWGDDVFARGCRTISVSMVDVQKILDARKSKLAKYDEFDLYQGLDIYDSGPAPINEIPYADAPIYSAGDPQNINVTVSGDDYNPGITGMGGGDSGARPARATADGRDVVYSRGDGTTYKRTGGTRAWRNNNPGNIRAGKFATDNGAIGAAGGFAVFPDEATGMNATKKLLRSDNYINLTVGDAISRYAPPFENDTAAYHRELQKRTGIAMNTPMSQLNDTQMNRVADAIKQIEGWKPGREA